MKSLRLEAFFNAALLRKDEIEQNPVVNRCGLWAFAPRLVTIMARRPVMFVLAATVCRRVKVQEEVHGKRTM